MNKPALALVRKDGRVPDAPAEQPIPLPGWMHEMNEQSLFSQQFTQQIANVAVIMNQVTTISGQLRAVAEEQKAAEAAAAIIRASIDDRLMQLNTGQTDLMRRVAVLESGGLFSWGPKKLAQLAAFVAALTTIVGGVGSFFYYLAHHLK